MAESEVTAPESVSEQMVHESQQNHSDGTRSDCASNSLEEVHDKPDKGKKIPSKGKNKSSKGDTSWVTNPKKINWGTFRCRKITQSDNVSQEGESADYDENDENYENKHSQEEENLSDDSHYSFWDDEDEDGDDEDWESEISDSEEVQETSGKRRKTGKNSSYKRFKPGASCSREVWLTADMADYVDEVFSTFTKDKLLQEEILDDFPVPTQDILTVPEVDEFIPNIFKTLKSSYGKPIDQNWQQVQAKVLNIMGPLSHLWRMLDRVKKGKGGPPDLQECLSLIEKIIVLVGQVKVCVNYHRRQSILYYLTKNIKEAKMLLKSNNALLEKKKKTLFGPSFYKSLCRLATVGKKSKAISDEFAPPTKRPAGRGRGRGRGRGGGKPFQKGPPSGRGGGGHKPSRGRGNKKGKLQHSFSLLPKQNNKIRNKSSVPSKGESKGLRANKRVKPKPSEGVIGVCVSKNSRFGENGKRYRSIDRESESGSVRNRRRKPTGPHCKS